MNTTHSRQPTAGLTLTAPLLPVAIGLLLGIVANEFRPMPIFWYALTLTVATILSLNAKLRLHLSWLLLGVASWSAGALLHASVTDTNAQSNITHYATDDGLIVRIRGVVLTVPRQIPPPKSLFSRWQRGSWRTSFVMESTAIETTSGWSNTVGRLRVSAYEPILDLEQGEIVELFGKLSTLMPPANPGAIDWSTYNRRQGILGRLTIKHRENIQRKSLKLERPAHTNWLQSAIRLTRTRLHQLLVEDLDQDSAAASQASLLDAMVLGQRSRVDRQLNDVFIRAGCVHFLAVSGVHVAIVMLLVVFGCRLIGLHPRKTTWVLIVSVLAYAMLVEPRPSVWRACVMALLYCASRLLNRQRASLNWLAASAICICIVDPNAAFNVGFQLSFVAVIGVIYLGPAIASTARSLAEKIRHPLSRSDITETQNIDHEQGALVLTDWRSTIKTDIVRTWHIATGAASVSIGAWFATLPLVLIHFQQIHPWGAISSIALFPLISMSMALGFVKLVMGVLSWPFMILVNGPLGLVNTLLLWCVNGFASLPYATVTAISPPWWLIGSFYLLALSLIARHRMTTNINGLQLLKVAQPDWDHASDLADGDVATANVTKSKDSRVDKPLDVDRMTTLDSSARELALIQQTQHRKRCAGLASLLSFVLFSTMLTSWLWPTHRKAELRITFLSVGAGSATVLELPSGETILFDAGSSGVYDIGLATVVPYLNSREITAVDRVYITHPNLDHYSGLPSITSTIRTGPIVFNRYFQSPYYHSQHKHKSASTTLLEYLQQQKQPIEWLDLDRRKWHIGDTMFELLWPPTKPLDGLSTNNSSTVLRITYAGHSILLTGDIEQRAQRDLLQIGNLNADVLALPHHGSIESTTAAFIRAVDAQSLIRSAGRAGYTTTKRLIDMSQGATLFNTENSGAITVILSKQGIQIQEYTPTVETKSANMRH